MKKTIVKIIVALFVGVLPMVACGSGSPAAPAPVVTPPVTPPVTGPVTSQIASVPVGFRLDPGGPGFGINLPNVQGGVLTLKIDAAGPAGTKMQAALWNDPQPAIQVTVFTNTGGAVSIDFPSFPGGAGWRFNVKNAGTVTVSGGGGAVYLTR